MTDKTILEVKNLDVDYGFGDDAVRAVSDVSFALGESKVLGVAGESGSGKSTLVYGLTRLLRAPGIIVGGEVNFRFPSESGEQDFDMLAASEEEIRQIRWSHVSIVLQSALSALNPLRRIGREFDEVFRTHDKSLSKEQRHERAQELLALVGLRPDRLKRFPHELSGGQRQRIMIAMALALRPELVIMDEPTTALDVVTQREIVSELAELRRQLGFAMIFITHDLSLLVELADDIMVMYAGQIVERAPAQELHDAPRHPYTLGLMNSFPPLHGERTELEGIPGSPPDLKALPTGCPFSPRCTFAIDKCHVERPPLILESGTEHSVACWLHDSSFAGAVPVELSKRVSHKTGRAQ
ncbi:MAG: ABC transporter ATP-binding protein [Actinomycetota bacterium]